MHIADVRMCFAVTKVPAQKASSFKNIPTTYGAEWGTIPFGIAFFGIDTLTNADSALY